MIDIGYAGALLGGIATILSPCSAMLLPAFFAYAFDSTRTLVTRTAIFYAGLLTTLVPLGVAAGSVGALFVAHRATFVTVASVAIIVLGAVQALGIPLPGIGAGVRGGTGAFAVYLLGTVYGIAGACAGPILGSVLSVAALGQDPVRGGVLLGIFAAGMVVPLLILALLWDVLGISGRRWLRPRPVTVGPCHTTVGQLVSGVLFIVIGVAMLLTDGLAGLGGVFGAQEQQALEVKILGFGARIADLVIVAIIAAVVGSCVAVHHFASSRRPEQVEQ